MATNEERRRVAEALRAKYRERTEGRTFGPQCLEMQYEAYLHDLESCLPDGESMFTVLADLIDPGCVATCGADGGAPNRDGRGDRGAQAEGGPRPDGREGVIGWASSWGGSSRRSC